MIRFHLDEHVDHAIASGLRQRGIDVTTTTDAGLLSSSDERHIAFALDQDRVLVTHDADFLRIHAAAPEHAGIVYCRTGMLTIGQIIAGLVLIHDCLSPDDMRRQVEFL